MASGQVHGGHPGKPWTAPQGGTLDPAKVEKGCLEEKGFMSQMHAWDRVTREEAKRGPDGGIRRHSVSLH